MDNFKGRVVAITGATGGLGNEICFALASDGAELIFVDRNLQKSKKLAEKIREKYQNIRINHITADLSNIKSVKEAAEKLSQTKFDTLILNAGIYNVPINKLDTGYNNVFQVNFISNYYLTKELLKNKKLSLKKIIVLGSIAHTFAKLNENDIDYSNCKKQSKIYGNSKRFLMFSFMELFKENKDVELAVVHPGVTLTNMTSHYPKLFNPVVKLFIKIFFPAPKKACKSVLLGLNEKVDYLECIGPSVFNIWGNPKKKKLKTCKQNEREKIANIAEKIYKNMQKI